MREIKFRAWKKSEKRMVGWDELNEFDAHTRSTILSDVLTGTYLEAVMQYTGLKDKNGKEIYEGDIVKRENMRFPDYRSIWRVQWREGSSGFALFVPATYEYPRGKRLMEKIMIGDTRNEIIGNIYENPELLKEKVDKQ
jgi:hypothetical protein